MGLVGFQAAVDIGVRFGLDPVIRLFYSDDRFITLSSHCEASFGKFTLERQLPPIPDISENCGYDRVAGLCSLLTFLLLGLQAAQTSRSSLFALPHCSFPKADVDQLCSISHGSA